MNYINLNLEYKRKMRGTCHNSERFEWEDTNIIELLEGNLPSIRNTSSKSDVVPLYHELLKEYKSYDFYATHPEEFIIKLKTIVQKIRQIEPSWSGLNIYSVQEALDLHKFCLVSGEGGIGKSYFVKCLEETLTTKGVKHLCVYGKFLKDLETIDFDEIKSISKDEEFVFVFDAINEIDENSQIKLANKLREIKSSRGLRIVITYRTHTMDESILQKYKEISESNYEFAGVSFESVLEWLQKEPVFDINEYADVLYSNNPLLLSKLPCIFKNKFEKNNVSRFTYIYEQYIKRTLDKPTWQKTKVVAKFMYENNRKDFSAEDISPIIDSPLDYISQMEQNGFLSGFHYSGETHYSFLVESLADFLIARYMWEEIKEKSIEGCIEIIKQKLESFFDMNKESVIIMLFDKFGSDYFKIKDILVGTGLLADFHPETIIKIHFNAEDISSFLQAFTLRNTKECILYFAGYLNKPFNCTNFINSYYFDDFQKQTTELSKTLSGKHFFSRLKGRLKNILYLICKCSCPKERTIENFYTAIWCSASCNQDVRLLAIKILYEIMQRNSWLVDTTIELFSKIEDDYIKDSLIYVLSSCENNTKVEAFFLSLSKDYDFVYAKSLKRIAEYLGNKYDYINWQKKNLFVSGEKEVSKDFSDTLSRIDLAEKDLMPFRFWGINSFSGNEDFLLTHKETISDFNQKLKGAFSCVKNGDCNGRLSFKEKAENYYGVSYRDVFLPVKEFLSSFEKTFTEILAKYGLSLKHEEYMYQDSSEFSNSIFRKCACIAKDCFYGSLMCNYYSSDFGTYNNIQESVGYEVYDPIEYGEEFNIKSPISIFQPKIEKMGDLVLTKYESSELIDEQWWRNIELTKKNVSNFLQPIKFENHEWVLLSARISFKDKPSHYSWKDNYNIFVCVSDEETLRSDGRERYLTIEIDDYWGNISNYKSCKDKPWLCKRIPEINYGSGLFEETQLVLPPAQIIDLLDLELNQEEMSWCNKSGEKIICCNNNRASYYTDFISGTVFIRKDAYEQLKKLVTVKHFVFAERLLEERGFCNETDYHFEIMDGKIIKAVSNGIHPHIGIKTDALAICENCKYGFYEPIEDSELKIILDDILSEYGV